MQKLTQILTIFFLTIFQGVAFAEEASGGGFAKKVDDGFGFIVGIMASTLFYGIPMPGGAKMPFIVLWLICGAVFFTIYMSFINIRGFKHAILVTAGKYDSPDDHGEVSHFQALSSALSATVGLGNIAGVAVAVGVGGPGAVFWMVMAACFGMTSKFVECTLGQKYREVREDGTVAGGPMYYLEKGLKEMNLGPLGKILGVMFAVFCIGGSLGGGNMFQANQSYVAVNDVTEKIGFTLSPSVYGVVLALLVGIVIVGGIKRIASVAEKIVPLMCGLYVLCGLAVLFANFSAIPTAFGQIFTMAFGTEAVTGGAIGVLIQGFKRAAFSNEAGVGSASIAHSAAKTDEPVREGIVALLEPFIDTIVVCTMTGLVITVTGAWQVEGLKGIEVTSYAFSSVFSWFPIVLSGAVVLFAFSTMVSWSYYGEKAWEYLFGSKSIMAYKGIFLVFVFIGSVSSLGNVIDFSDMMILAMAFPNILGGVLLSGKVKNDLNIYWNKLTSGEFKVYK